MTRILVEGGTDTNVRNKQNETALDIAVRKKLSDVVTILECNSIQNIISDLEPSAEEVPGVREAVRQRERERAPSDRDRGKHSVRTPNLPVTAQTSPLCPPPTLLTTRATSGQSRNTARNPGPERGQSDLTIVTAVHCWRGSARPSRRTRRTS